MATDFPVTLNRDQTASFVKYFESIKIADGEMFDFRSQMEEADTAYARESDRSEETLQARLARLRGDIKKIRNVEIPIVKPQVESAVTYLASVFLSGFPIFGVTAGPKNIDIAQQWNTLMINHAMKGQWVRQLQMFFRDGAKYNLHGLHVYWDQKVSFVPETAATSTRATAKKVIWEGNRLDRMDMYNTFWDRRVNPADVHAHGEYVGFNELVSRVELKRRLEQLPSTFNLASAMKSTFDDSLYYVPQINKGVFHDKKSATHGTNWDSWFSGSYSSKTMPFTNSSIYVLTTLYCRIIPADFGLFGVPGKTSPQIWKLLLVNGKYPVYAERLNNLHDYLPIVLGQPLEDGLGLQTKSLATDVLPFQDLSSALWTSRLHAARRRISDRIAYNSNVIDKREISKPDAAAKIAVRLPAYNSDVRTALYQIPFEDGASAYFSQEINALAEFSFYASGQNKVQQGQFQKGNKTLEEFNVTMSNANGRNQTMAQFSEDQVFTPVKEILKLNIMQNQAQVTLYNPVDDNMVKINPENLRKVEAEFKISDGMAPASKMMSTEEFGIAMQAIAASPALQQDYKLGPLFSYVMKLRGVDGLNNFEFSPAEKLYKQQLASWQQVAMEAIKAGQQPPPQPQPPAELQQQMQQEQARNADTEISSNTSL